MSEPALARADDLPPEPPAARPPKTKRTWLWIAIAAAVLLVVAIVVIVFLVSNGTAASTPSATAVATQEPEETEPPVEEETPPPPPTLDETLGSFENPHPIGATMYFTDGSTGEDALTAQVRQMNQAEFETTTGATESGVATPPAPEGMVNVFLEYTVTNLAPEPYPATDESGYWSVVDEDGNQYVVYARHTADQNVLPVESGASWEGHAIYQVPADAKGLLFLMYDAHIRL